MSSVKAVLGDLCVILLVGFVLAANVPVSPIAQADDGPKGNCTCGGFPTHTAAPGDTPVIAQSPGLEVKCDEDGENTCKQLCNALATAAKAKGPEVLCIRLKDAEEIKLSAFYKTCDNPWTYAEMTADEALCCENSKPKICASVGENNTTTTRRPVDL